MKELFLQILNMSITASWLVAVIALIRLIFKKAPKSVLCFLWVFVAIRLVLPISFGSSFSLVPNVPEISEISIPSYQAAQLEPSIVIGTQITVPSNPESEQIISDTTKSFHYELEDDLAVVWLGGIALMLGYALLSTIRIKKKVSISVVLQDNVWICDDLSSAFILGVIKPRIYLPSYLSEQETEHVLAHEQAHLKRMDHWWKPLGYSLLSVHWFNPVMWIAYGLLCSDIELACDEKVIKTLGEENKKEYSKTLLSYSVPRRMIMACPLAFGEVSVKQRVKSVLNYKKPAFWVLAVSLVLCVALPFFFLSDPLSDEEVIQNNTVHFIQSLGEFTDRFEETYNQFTTLCNQKMNKLPALASQEEKNKIVEQAYQEAFKVFTIDVQKAYTYLNQEQIEKLYMNRMFSWPLNEPYETEFKEVKAYENSFASTGYAVMEDSRWRFDITWVKENGKIKMTGFSFRQVEDSNKQEEVAEVFEAKGQILGSQNLGEQSCFMFLSSTNESNWIYAEQSQLSGIKLGDGVKISYRRTRNEQTKEEEMHLLTIEKLNTHSGIYEITLMNEIEGMLNVYFSTDNPNDNLNVKVVPSTFAEYKEGDIVEVMYETYRVDAMDDKSYEDYELISVRKAGGYYEDGTTLSEVLGNEPVKIEIERKAYVIGGESEFLILEDEKVIASFMKEMDSLTVYKDFIVEPGAGGEKFIIKFTLENGMTIEAEIYDTIKLLLHMVSMSLNWDTILLKRIKGRMLQCC